MRLKDTIKAAKKIIKARKNNKACYTKEEVLYAKLLKRRAETMVEIKHNVRSSENT